MSQNCLSISHDEESGSFFVPDLSSINCMTNIEARKALSSGMKKAKYRSSSLNQSTSRNHTIVLIQPVAMEDQENFTMGGQLTIIDASMIQRAKKMSAENKRDNVVINPTIASVINCLSTIKENSEHMQLFRKGVKVVPYNESILTMFLQPFLSGMLGPTTIMILVSLNPGSSDYSEKEALLREIRTIDELQQDADAENIEPNNVHQPGSANKKRKGFTPSKLIKKSPLRHLPKVMNSIQETTSQLSTKRQEKVQSTLTSEQTKALMEENNRLRNEIDHLQSSNKQLSESNRELYRKMKTFEQRIQKCGPDIQEETFHNEEYLEYEREVRHKRQNLIPSPLHKHCHDAIDTNDTKSGYLQKAKCDPFKLVVPNTWTLGKKPEN